MAHNRRQKFYMRSLETTDLPAVARLLTDLDDLSLFDRSLRIPLSVHSLEKSWSDILGNDGKHNGYWFAIEETEKELVGIIGIEGLNWINRDGTVPMCIIRKLRKKGIGTRALALLLDIAFLQLGLNRLTSYYRVDNESSRALTERVGFREEGRMRHAWFAEGRYFDMVVIGILRQEWIERRETLAEELDEAIVLSFGHSPSGSWSWPARGARSDA